MTANRARPSRCHSAHASPKCPLRRARSSSSTRAQGSTSQTSRPSRRYSAPTRCLPAAPSARRQSRRLGASLARTAAADAPRGRAGQLACASDCLVVADGHVLKLCAPLPPPPAAGAPRPPPPICGQSRLRPKLRTKLQGRVRPTRAARGGGAGTPSPGGAWQWWTAPSLTRVCSGAPRGPAAAQRQVSVQHRDMSLCCVLRAVSFQADAERARARARQARGGPLCVRPRLQALGVLRI